MVVDVVSSRVDEMASAGSDARPTCPPLPISPDAGSNVLVLAPAMEAAADEACGDLLTHGNPARENVLLVSMVRPTDERLALVRGHGGSLPSKVGVVGAGDGARSAAAASPATTEVAGSTVRIATVSEPGDLTGIGIEISQALSAWEDDDALTSLCFHSVTGLLQYADLRRAFQFLHVLAKRTDAVDGIAHYHMDPTAHDDRTVSTLRPLFDTVVEVSPDGSVDVR